jgi:hypothetical protein
MTSTLQSKPAADDEPKAPKGGASTSIFGVNPAPATSSLNLSGIGIPKPDDKSSLGSLTAQKVDDDKKSPFSATGASTATALGGGLFASAPTDQKKAEEKKKDLSNIGLNFSGPSTPSF